MQLNYYISIFGIFLRETNQHYEGGRDLHAIKQVTKFIVALKDRVCVAQLNGQRDDMQGTK
jgi:hypothetical protein